MRTVTKALLGAICCIAVFLPLSVGGAAAKTLRVVMHSDLKILDPHWSFGYIVRNHGYMIYDTLFALDEKLEVQPQMVDRWEASADKLTYTFVLREGLFWHDDEPVTSEDCIASLKRWAVKDSMGSLLMKHVKELRVVDNKTFEIVLSEPYGLVLQSLGKPSSLVPFMMPKRVAETDANKQISEFVGSGPFIFLKDEWRPGNKTVYAKNPKYKPRSELTSGLAGAKIVKVDRVEWIWIPDSLSQVDALANGEIDMIEAPRHDLLPTLAASKGVELVDANPLGASYVMRFTTIHKPFDNPKARQAVLYAFNQKDFLNAGIGDPKWFRLCKSMYMCGTPLETTKGWDDKLGSNFVKARELLQEAGYDGTPIVIMQQTDVPALGNLAPVAKSLLEKAGFKVDLVPLDAQSILMRRPRKNLPANGGWHAYFAYLFATDIYQPISNFFNASCSDAAGAGWPCDPQTEMLREQYAKETDPTKQRALAEALHVRQSEYPNFVHLGQWVNPIARRRNVTGNIAGPVTAFWNVEVK